MTDPVDRNSAEDLDEDRLRLDPLEEGMDPPEHWSPAMEQGTTPREEREGQDLDHRLLEEQPDNSQPPPPPVDEVDRMAVDGELEGHPPNGQAPREVDELRRTADEDDRSVRTPRD